MAEREGFEPEENTAAREVSSSSSSLEVAIFRVSTTHSPSTQKYFS
jgi:hypothetical protein